MYIQNERANILPESNTDSRQWQRLKRQLGDCKECAHHYTRHHMFLYRGHIPCDILFISQYSTSVDDMTGLPMAHNGQRDTIANIRATSPDNTTPGTSPIKTGVTCLMACHAETPTNKQIDTCSTHIHKIVEMCTPAAIIYLGPKRPGYINDLSTHVFYAEHPHTILSNTDAIKRITARRSIEKAVERATEVVYNTNKIFDVGKPR